MSEQFANWLKQKIADRGLSLRAASLYSGLGVTTLQRLVNEPDRIPDPETCRKLAEYFDTDPDYVLALAGHREVKVPWEHDLEYSPEVLELMAKVNALPPDVRAETMAMIERMLDAIETFQRGRREERE